MSENDANIRERQFPVEKKHEGMRLDQFISTVIPRLSRSRAGEIAKHGDIQILPNKKVKAGTRLKDGDIVVVREHLPPETYDDSRIEILFEDEFLLAINKPAGVLVHEAAKVRLNTVQAFLHRAGYDNAEPAHRLDRDTSGVLLCAKTKTATSVLKSMFATDHPEKIYRALVEDSGQVWKVGDETVMTTPLGLDANSKARVRMTKGDLSATTHVRCVARGPDLADLQVRIETGRQHQIRIHLAMQGTPVAGDKLYIYDDDFFCAIADDPSDPDLLSKLRFPSHALHAWVLSFEHPFAGTPIRFEAPLPTFWASESFETFV